MLRLANHIFNESIYHATPANSKSFDVRNKEKETAQNVSVRLKYSENKFSRNLEQCQQEYKDSFDRVTEDYDLLNDQHLPFSHTLLHKNAPRFCLENVKFFASTYEEVSHILKKEYNSIVRQKIIKIYLNTFYLEQFMNELLDIAAALSIVYKRIPSLSRQVLLSHRGDFHRTEFSREAVAGYAWAKEPPSCVATTGILFKQLYAKLQIAVQSERESLDVVNATK